jgi:hypothetical protein
MEQTILNLNQHVNVGIEGSFFSAEFNALCQSFDLQTTETALQQHDSELILKAELFAQRSTKNIVASLRHTSTADFLFCKLGAFLGEATSPNLAESYNICVVPSLLTKL